MFYLIPSFLMHEFNKKSKRYKKILIFPGAAAHIRHTESPAKSGSIPPRETVTVGRLVQFMVWHEICFGFQNMLLAFLDFITWNKGR